MLKKLMQLLVGYVGLTLALWAQGTASYGGLAKETTWNTAVAATDYFELMSENLTLSIDRFPTRNAFGGFYEPDDVAGANRVAGDISMFGHPLSMGFLLKAAMNTHSITSILSGFLWRNNFSTVKSEFADGVPTQPYTLEIHRDTGSSYRYAGALCNRLSMNVVPNQDLRLTVGWVAAQPSIIAKTTPTFPGSPTDPFTFDTVSLSIGGSATSRWEAFTLDVDNGLTGIMALNNSKYIARLRRSQDQRVRIRGVLDFIDQAEYDDFVNQTERRLFLNMTRSQSFSLLIDVPRFIYNTYPTGVPGRDRLTVGFDGIARYSTGSGLAINFGLTTVKSNY